MSYTTGTSPTYAELVTGKFIPEIFSTKVISFLKRKLVIVPLVSHDYQADLTKGQTVSIPVINEPTAYEVQPGVALTVSNMVGTPLTLTVNKWYGARTEVHEMADIENKPAYLDATAAGCAYSLAKEVDRTLGYLFSTLSTSLGVYGSDGQTFTDDMLIEINEGLDEADVPPERVCVSDPSVKADALKIDKFVSIDYTKTPVVPTGKFGTWYDMEIYFTNNLTQASIGNYGAVFSKNAMGIVIQANPYSQRIPEPKLHTITYQAKTLWGVGELQETCGRAFYTRKT